MAAEVTDDAVYIMKLGSSYNYTVPGFSVINSGMQKSSDDGEVQLF
jgi:hypothetical protein